MANKVTVTISGTEYTLVSEESPSYMQKVATLVDDKMTDIMAAGRVSRMDAAVLAAANLADELLKQQAAAENLRRQLKGYLDDASKAKAELGECKRQLLKLQQQKRWWSFFPPPGAGKPWPQRCRTARTRCIWAADGSTHAAARRTSPPDSCPRPSPTAIFGEQRCISPSTPSSPTGSWVRPGSFCA